MQEATQRRWGICLAFGQDRVKLRPDDHLLRVQTKTRREAVSRYTIGGALSTNFGTFFSVKKSIAIDVIERRENSMRWTICNQEKY